MKRGTPRHPKTLDLAGRLNKPIYCAVGLLEMLWHFTSEFAPDGNLSSYDNAMIPSQLGWDGGADVLIDALVSARFVDRRRGKLLIHHWPEHCEDSVHMKLARARKTFADGTLPKANRLPAGERLEAEKWLTNRAHAVHTPSTRRDRALAKPSHSLSQAKPSPAPAARAGKPDDSATDVDSTEGSKRDHGLGLGRAAQQFMSRIGDGRGICDPDLSAALREVGIEGKAFGDLARRKDLTGAIVREHWQRLKNIINIDNPAGALVSYLNKHNFNAGGKQATGCD